MKVIKKYLPYVVVGLVAAIVWAEAAPWYARGRRMLTKKGVAA